jgi:hypothetical protein
MGAETAGGLSNIFSESWRLLVHNPAIVLPGILIGFAKSLLEVAISPGLEGGTAQHVATIVLGYVIQLVATIASIAFTTGMAAAAWERGTGTFGDGWSALTRDGGRVAVAFLGVLLLGGIAGILIAYTYGLSAIAFGFFCLYVMASAVVGERNGLAAIRESWTIAYERVVQTLGIAFGLFVIFLAVGIAAEAVALVQGVGALPAAILATLLIGATLAYASLVIVGEYLVYRRAEQLA